MYRYVIDKFVCLYVILNSDLFRHILSVDLTWDYFVYSLQNLVIFIFILTSVIHHNNLTIISFVVVALMCLVYVFPGGCV